MQDLARAPMTSESYTPEFASTDTGAHLPTVEVRPIFQFAFHPGRWTVIAGMLVPALASVHLVDGAERVSQIKGGKFRMADAKAKWEERGYMLIPYTKGPGGKSYLRRVITKPADGQEVYTYLSVWEDAFAGSSETTCDEEGYATWLRGLIASGYLPDCPAHLARRMLEQKTVELAEAQSAVADGKTAFIARAKALSVICKTLEEASERRGLRVAAEATTPDLVEDEED